MLASFIEIFHAHSDYFLDCYDPQDYSNVNWVRVGRLNSINTLMKKVAAQFSYILTEDTLHDMMILCKTIYLVKKINVCTYTLEMQVLWRLYRRLVSDSAIDSDKNMQFFDMLSSSVHGCNLFELDGYVRVWIHNEIRLLRAFC